MTLKEQVNTLRKQGNKITYRTRNDGGIIIKSINGVKYTGASGNKIVRSMSGQALSEKQTSQLSYNVEKFIKKAKKTKTLDVENKKILRDLQKGMRKTKTTGRITAKKYKYHMKEGTLKEYVERTQAYIKGEAYQGDLFFVIKELRTYQRGQSQDVRTRLQRIIDWFQNKIDTKSPVSQELVNAVMEKMYDVSHKTKSIQESLKYIENRLNL